MRAGEAFEREVKRLLEMELNRGALGIDPRSAKVFLHKAYPSKIRGKPIIMDVSLELYRQHNIEPYWVWIWECKDYEHSVPIDDVEEFHAKLEQIGLHKTKGTIASRNGFQEGSLTAAQAWGIGLVRILPEGSIIRLLEAFRIPSRESIMFGLTQPDTRRIEGMFYGMTSLGLAVTSMQELFSLEVSEIGKTT